ncbi:MAG: hypothetical protein R3E96_03015 [Planctomycetota bacterium]
MTQRKLFEQGDLVRCAVAGETIDRHGLLEVVQGLSEVAPIGGGIEVESDAVAVDPRETQAGQGLIVFEQRRDAQGGAGGVRLDQRRRHPFGVGARGAIPAGAETLPDRSPIATAPHGPAAGAPGEQAIGCMAVEARQAPFARRLQPTAFSGLELETRCMGAARLQVPDLTAIAPHLDAHDAFGRQTVRGLPAQVVPRILPGAH